MVEWRVPTEAPRFLDARAPQLEDPRQPKLLYDFTVFTPNLALTAALCAVLSTAGVPVRGVGLCMDEFIRCSGCSYTILYRVLAL